MTDFFEKYKQRMAEKPSLVEEFQSLLKIDETEKPSFLEKKESLDSRKDFLLKLDQIVSALLIALLKLMRAKKYYVFLLKLTY